MDLPVNILNRLSTLPVVQFGDFDNFQNVLVSPGFDEIFNYYKTNFPNEALKTQSEVYQRTSLYLYLTNQDAEFIDSVDDLIYLRPVPQIEDFLTNPRYMGLQNGTMYPYWHKILIDVFKEGSTTNRVLWTGATGTGKTVTARKATIYSLYRLLCLRNACATLNVEYGSTLAVFILSVTQKNAYQTNFEPFINILSNMPCFQRVRSVNSFSSFDIANPDCPIPFMLDKTNLTLVFPNNFILTMGSQISNTVGYDIVISACDEINEAGVEKGMELLNSIDGRLDSRFSGSPFIFQNVMSSARGATASVTREYLKKWKHDSKFKLIAPMRFEVKQSAEFVGDGSTFPVLIGNGIIPSSIIEDEAEIKEIEEGNYKLPTGCELVKVPTIYQPLFKADLEQQIQDTLGIDTADTSNVFKDTSKLEDRRLTPELSYLANLNENFNILANLPDGIFEKNLRDRYALKRAPAAPRYAHLDLAGDGKCDAAFCMLHKEWALNPETNLRETMYIVDLMIFINAKNKLDLEAVQNFCKSLPLERQVNIHTISADQYQSKMMLDNFEASRLFKNVKKVSVDLTLEPYNSAATLVEGGRVKVGVCPKLTAELEALVIEKGKVAKTTELKDGADAIVGALYNAQMAHSDIPQYQYFAKDTDQKPFEYNDLLETNEILDTLY